MTIASTWGYTYEDGPVPNDQIDLKAWGVESLNELVTTITISKGSETTENGPKNYVNFAVSFDFDDDPDTDFVLNLDNIVSQGVFDNMLKALDVVEGNEGMSSTRDLIDDDFDLGTAWTNLELTDKGNFHSHSYATWAEEADSSITLEGTAMLGLVGILVDEGTLIL